MPRCWNSDIIYWKNYENAFSTEGDKRLDFDTYKCHVNVRKTASNLYYISKEKLQQFYTYGRLQFVMKCVLQRIEKTRQCPEFPECNITHQRMQVSFV